MFDEIFISPIELPNGKNSKLRGIKIELWNKKSPRELEDMILL